MTLQDIGLNDNHGADVDERRIVIVVFLDQPDLWALHRKSRRIRDSATGLNPDQASIPAQTRSILSSAKLSCHAKPAKPAKEPAYKTPLDERRYDSSPSVQSLYIVELRLSSYIRLAHQTHARRVHVL